MICLGRAGTWGVIALFAIGCESPIESKATSLNVRQTMTPWTGGPAGGVLIESDHYRVFTTVGPGVLRDGFAGFLEAGLSEYQRLTMLTIRDDCKPMETYLLASRDQWAKLTEATLGPKGPSSVVEQGAYTYRGVTVCWNIGGLATYAVASHEAMHQFLQHRLVDRLPRWANEGWATTAEGLLVHGGTVRFTPNRNVLRLGDLERALTQGHWMPIRELLSGDTMDRARVGQRQAVSMYGQLYALMHLLRNEPDYRDGLMKLMADAARGTLRTHLTAREKRLTGQAYHQATARKLFEIYITDDLDSFEIKYKTYARDLIGL